MKYKKYRLLVDDLKQPESLGLKVISTHTSSEDAELALESVRESGEYKGCMIYIDSGQFYQEIVW